MKFIAENWYNILFVIAVIVGCSYGVMTNKVIIWLRAIVVETEKYFGSGSGQLKLADAYNSFVATFPIFKTIVPFKLFAYWVDIALKWLNKQLAENPRVKEIVEDGKGE